MLEANIVWCKCNILSRSLGMEIMLEQSRLLAKMFLDYRKHSGAHNFRFRPRLQRQNGMDVVDVRARAGEFDAKVFLRPGTSDWAVFEQVFLAGHYDVSRLARF